jgi:hypothetical protein
MSGAAATPTSASRSMIDALGIKDPKAPKDEDDTTQNSRRKAAYVHNQLVISDVVV